MISYDFTCCWSELPDWLDSIKRKRDALIEDSQVCDSSASEKPRPARVTTTEAKQNPNAGF